jgi:hypothetical protein
MYHDLSIGSWVSVIRRAFGFKKENAGAATDLGHSGEPISFALGPKPRSELWPDLL